MAWAILTLKRSWAILTLKRTTIQIQRLIECPSVVLFCFILYCVVFSDRFLLLCCVFICFLPCFSLVLYAFLHSFACFDMLFPCVCLLLFGFACLLLHVFVYPFACFYMLFSMLLLASTLFFIGFCLLLIGVLRCFA